MKLNEMQQKNQHYHQIKLINILQEYLTGEEILPSDQRRVIEQAKCTHSSLSIASEKQNKND